MNYDVPGKTYRWDKNLGVTGHPILVKSNHTKKHSPAVEGMKSARLE